MVTVDAVESLCDVQLSLFDGLVQPGVAKTGLGRRRQNVADLAARGATMPEPLLARRAHQWSDHYRPLELVVSRSPARWAVSDPSIRALSECASSCRCDVILRLTSSAASQTYRVAKGSSGTIWMLTRTAVLVQRTALAGLSGLRRRRSARSRRSSVARNSERLTLMRTRAALQPRSAATPGSSDVSRTILYLPVSGCRVLMLERGVISTRVMRQTAVRRSA